jgi:hypothetical protein
VVEAGSMDQELAIARAVNDLHKYLQAAAVLQHPTPLDPVRTYADLVTVFTSATLNQLGWGDLFMMDMMYAKAGGKYMIREHGRPELHSEIRIQNEPYIVTGVGMFTFDAESVESLRAQAESWEMQQEEQEG